MRFNGVGGANINKEILDSSQRWQASDDKVYFPKSDITDINEEDTSSISDTDSPCMKL